MSTLELRARGSRGALALDVDLRLPAAGVTALFGASGAGKTTLLRCIAGFERLPGARVAFQEETWQDEARSTFVPAWRRPVAMVFQEPALFPHRTVRGNLLYAWRRVPAARRRVAPDEAIAWLGLEHLLERRPAGLSGGERQRVAIARALLASPRLLLMDEPLSALDEPSRRAILPALEDLARRLAIPLLYVTHATAEVARLADRMVWIEAGRVRRVGPTAELLSSIELGLARGDDAGAVVEGAVARHDEADHLTELTVPGGVFLVDRVARPPGERVRLQVRARDVSLGLEPERASSVLNELACTVLELGEAGPGRVLVRLGTAGGADAPGTVLLARVTRRSARALALAPGRAVYARVKSVALVS